MLENEEELETRVFLALAAKDCSFIRFILLVFCFFLCLAPIAFSPQLPDPPPPSPSLPIAPTPPSIAPFPFLLIEFSALFFSKVAIREPAKS